MSSECPPERWHRFFSDLDASLTEPVRLHCLGGFALLARYGSPRPTLDVDCVALEPVASIEQILEIAGLGSALHRQHGLYIQHVGIVTVPDDYEMRLVEVYPGIYARLTILALEAHDVALAKLERNLERDRDDVRFLAKAAPLDPEILDRRYREEMRPYLVFP